MASTEGTSSYSDFQIDRTGALTDNVSGSPNTANRVRGIGSANVAFNNIETTGRVPIDPLWIDSIELSRGPNANIFGLGNTSGTVNQVAATANLLRDFTTLELRGDSYGGWRTSLDVNRRIWGKKLAVRASLAHQHTGFIREPSGEDARRTSFQIKSQPFKNTTVSVSWFGYRNAAVRPNFTTPRDYITGWRAAGQPSWNPVTRLYTLNGVTYGQGAGNLPVAGSTTPWTVTPPSTLFLAAPDNRSVFRIGANGEAPYWSTPTITSTTAATATDPFQGATTSNIRFLNTAAYTPYLGSNQPLFPTNPAVSDKSIYNWEKINLMGNDKAWDNVNTYLGQLDQIFINSQKQTLAAQATFMREDSKRMENLPMGPASVNSTVGQLMADPNLVNLDGSPNPYFGRPYLKTTEPFLKEIPQVWDTTRAQLAYKLDFSRDSGWSKWIGTQQLLGYYEYKDRQNRQYSYRHSATSLDQPWEQAYAAANTPLGNRTTANTAAQYPIAPGNYARTFDQYYVGNTPGGGVEYAPNFFPEGATLPFVWGNPTNGWHYNPTTIGWTPSPDGGGGQASTQTIVKTMGAIWQSTILDGMLVGTFGLRQDKVFDRNAPFATLTPDLRAYDRGLSDQWLPNWRMAQGKTKTVMFVVRPFKDIAYLKAQATSGSGIGRYFAQAVTSLGLTSNRSDSFIPQGPAVDLFLRPLPNQTGTTSDLGFWMTTFDSKLTLRYNHFTTKQLNYRNGDINTIAQRILRIDGLNASDRWNLQDRSTAWITQMNPTWTTAQIRAESNRVMGMTEEQVSGLENAIANNTLAATQDIVSRGDELEINFNPTSAWTVSASITKTESINKNAGSTIDDWIAYRMPTWTAVEDPRFTATTYTPPLTTPPTPPTTYTTTLPVGATGHLLWWNITGSIATAAGYDANNSAASNFNGNVKAPLSVYRQLEDRPRPQLRKYSAKFNTKYQLSGLTDNKILKNVAVGGSLRWADKAAIGFYGLEYDSNATYNTTTNPMPTITALDANRPIYTPAEKYIDLFITYKTKMFRDKIRATYQFNVKNVGEKGGGLLPVQAFPDGAPLAYRIIDPRQFILSVSFDL